MDTGGILADAIPVTLYRDRDGYTVIESNGDPYCHCDRHAKPHTHTFEHRDGCCYLYTHPVPRPRRIAG